MALYAMRFHWK